MVSETSFYDFWRVVFNTPPRPWDSMPDPAFDRVKPKPEYCFWVLVSAYLTETSAKYSLFEFVSTELWFSAETSAVLK